MPSGIEVADGVDIKRGANDLRFVSHTLVVQPGSPTDHELDGGTRVRRRESGRSGGVAYAHLPGPEQCDALLGGLSRGLDANENGTAAGLASHRRAESHVLCPMADVGVADVLKLS